MVFITFKYDHSFSSPRSNKDLCSQTINKDSYSKYSNF